MGDYTIQARLEAACRPEDVLPWLTTVEGIAGWWTDSVTGAAGERGDTFRARFPTTEVAFDLEVMELSDRAIEWHVPESPPWWKGTTVRFDLGESEDGGASFLFTHRGFEPDDPLIPVITPAWIRFLDRLVEVAETGEANPVVVN